MMAVGFSVAVVVVVAVVEMSAVSGITPVEESSVFPSPLCAARGVHSAFMMNGPASLGRLGSDLDVVVGLGVSFRSGLSAVKKTT
jgi:hypothetical protein